LGLILVDLLQVVAAEVLVARCNRHQIRKSFLEANKFIGASLSKVRQRR
jgi:hypothetical protein